MSTIPNPPETDRQRAAWHIRSSEAKRLVLPDFSLRDFAEAKPRLDRAIADRNAARDADA